MLILRNMKLILIKKYEVDFELYHKDDYVGKINCNGRVFGEDEEKQLEKYLKREKLPSLVGVVMPVIYKILNDEELPSKNYQSKKKAYKVVIKKDWTIVQFFFFVITRQDYIFDV